MSSKHDPLADPAPLIRRVFAYAAYRLGDAQEAEDVTSETLERALRYRESFDPRKGQPVTWLLGIASRCVADALQRRAAERRTEAEPEGRGEDVEAVVADRVDLARALATLDDRGRELIALGTVPTCPRVRSQRPSSSRRTRSTWPCIAR